MHECFLPTGVARPDFYIAAIGRSGSTMLCNWLTQAPDRLVFMEPFFLRPENSRLLRIQLEQLGMPIPDEDWALRPFEEARGRFVRLMGPRLVGRRWALKEVLAEEHHRVLEQLKPQRLVICVRNIVDVALSFFEKHRLQNNLDRFSDEWVSAYCIRESAALVELRQVAAQQRLPCHVVRYEDFTQRKQSRQELARFVGWNGGGDVAVGLVAYGRGFEVQRHGAAISQQVRKSDERSLPAERRTAAQLIARKCREYQSLFGYPVGLNGNLAPEPPI